ncbi:hypothetical protein M1D88_11375 [Arthrobacter sp. R1-13]
MSVQNYVIFINGTYGTGKSSALDHVGDALAAVGQPFTLMDVDWFHRSWPPAIDDPENVLTEAKNLSAAWNNYRATGARQLVVSGVISTTEDLARYASAFDLPVRPVRLVANGEQIEARLRRRYTPAQTHSLDWHLARFRNLDEQLTTARMDEITIDTSERTPAMVAKDVLTHFGFKLSAEAAGRDLVS